VALNINNGKLYTSSELTMRVMGSDIFGKLRMRIMSFLLILLCGDMLMITCCGFENM